MAEEQTNPENDSSVEQSVEAEQTTPTQQTAVSHEHRNQWISFGILVVVLLVVVVGIALLRPVIFTQIVPAVMGDFVTPAATAVEQTAPVENQSPDADTAYPGNPEKANSGGNEVFIPAASGGGGPDSAEAEGNETVEGETAVTPAPTPEPTTHTVQVGDTLTRISQQYGVSIPEIMVANNLPNADNIAVGQVLVIPLP